MTRAAGGLVDVTDVPVMGTVLSITANTAGGYTASLAGGQLFVGGTHVVLSGTITRPVAAGVGLQRAVTIGTVPAALRPTQARRVICAMGNATPAAGTSGTTAVQILTTGEIQLTGASDTINPQSTAYLDAIMYPI